MTHRDFLAWLRHIESRFPVTEWRVRGIRVWPLVRLGIYGSNFFARTPEHSLAAGWRGYARIAASGVAAWAQAGLSDWRNNVRPGRRADAVFLAYSVGRQPLVEGRRFNPLLAPYVELLRRQGRESVAWEMSPFGDYNVPRHTPSAFIQPHMIGLRFLSEVFAPGHRAKPWELEGYEEFLRLAAEAGLECPHGRRLRLERDVAFLQRTAALFRRWLRATGARIGFVADASIRDQAFCLACRQLGVVSVEIQHGVQGEVHPAYSEWTVLPAGGFETRPRAFWCWDEGSTAVINAWAGAAPDAHVAITGGDPWRELWLGRTTDIARRVHAEIAARTSATGAAHHILVTLSSNRELLPGQLLSAMREAPADWCFWLRLHPVNQAPRRLEAIALLGPDREAVVRMEFATQVPLHALLRHMQAHVTVGLSTVVMEAAEVGVPSVGLMEEATDFYRRELKAGLVRVALTREAVSEALRDFLEHPPSAMEVRRPDSHGAMAKLFTLSPAPAP